MPVPVNNYHILLLTIIILPLIFFDILIFFVASRQYTRHKSFVGGKIDVEVLELWEESLDGSGEKI